VTAIEWTDATWNPVTGCSKVSPGCAHCYAETLSLRFGWSKLPWTPENAEANVVLHPDRLDKPLRWRKPRMVFVNSMSDLFHELVPDDFLRTAFGVMASSEHTYQVLTKRPERARDFFERHHWRAGLMPWVAPSGRTDLLYRFPVPNDLADDPGGIPVDHPPENIWLGTSIENNRWTIRADALRETPAAVRFVSAEPLLGPLLDLDLTGIDWLIVGGESGVGARAMHAQWAKDLRDRAVENGTAFFFKQWGGRTPKAGGRTLDGVIWDEYPQPKVPV